MYKYRKEDAYNAQSIGSRVIPITAKKYGIHFSTKPGVTTNPEDCSPVPATGVDAGVEMTGGVMADGIMADDVTDVPVVDVDVDIDRGALDVETTDGNVEMTYGDVGTIGMLDVVVAAEPGAWQCGLLLLSR